MPVHANPAEPLEPNAARREAILETAVGVFSRYGFKKTSMDDLASVAGISRQGLYLHFESKEALFKACVIHMTQQIRATSQAALDRDDLPIEDRLMGAFAALKSRAHGDDMTEEHMAELLATAVQLVGPLIEEMEQALIADLTRVLHSSGVAARWKDAGLSAKELAQHLSAASQGLKHCCKAPTDYRDRMRVAVRLVCRGPVGTRK